MHTHGGAAQLEVGSLPVSVSRPSALHCYLCLTHHSPGNVPNPTPGPLSTPLVNTGQPTLYHYYSGLVSHLYNKIKCITLLTYDDDDDDDDDRPKPRT